jgi:DNA-binding GntR family transcriptional regulator
LARRPSAPPSKISSAAAALDPAPHSNPLPVRSGVPGTLASAAYQRLRDEIIGGALPPGVRLHTRLLCERLTIGLSPLREALNRLSSEGLVTQIDQRGFRVALLDLDDLHDLTRTRCWVGEAALRASLANGDQAWEEAVIIAFHRLERAPKTIEGRDGRRDPEWELAHRRFHHALIAACDSVRWLKIWEEMFDAADRYRFASRLASADRRDVAGEHAAIRNAALARDVDGAIALHDAHIRKTEELVRDSLLSASRPKEPGRA